MEAVQAARQSQVAIIVAGIIEGEFQDRAKLSLPGRQEEMIKKVAATGVPTVVVLIGGSAVTMANWIDDVDAVLCAWYPGDQGGEAIANTLLGNYNPGGKLPITFPMHEGQLPLIYNHKPTGRGDDYVNLSGRPLFPFGFGLSYTTFSYSNCNVEKKEFYTDESIHVEFELENTGALAGDEVVQLYVKDLVSSVVRPVMELKGFQRIHLGPGEKQIVKFEVTPAMLSMLDLNLKRVVEPGMFRIMIGSSSNDIKLIEDVKVIERE
jgi:beta-glucosidase